MRNQRKLICTSLLVAAPMMAGEKVKKTPKLPEVVVTDSKISQPQAKVTQQIEVIYAEDVDHQPVGNRNLAELLQYQPGLFVDVLSRNDANWGSFGGIGPKYSTYLLDGLPIDSFVDSMSLDPWAFQQIEVQKGPASIMYSNYLSMDFAGNEAPLAGTTNFVLKDQVEGAATRFQMGGGSYQTGAGRFYHQDRKGNLSYFFGGSYEQSNYTNYGTDPSWLHFTKDPEYQKTKLYAKQTYSFDGDTQRISIFFDHTQHTGDAGRPNRDYAHAYDALNLSYFNQMSSDLNLQFKAGHRNYDRRWAEDNYPDLSLREHDGVKQSIIPVDLTLNLSHANGLLTFGADAQSAKYRTYAEVDGIRSTGNDASARSTGIYVQEKFIQGPWVLRAGGRFNRTSSTYTLISGGQPGLQDQSWNKALWSLGARYNASPTMAFFVNSGSSFVAPGAKAVCGTLMASDAGMADRNGQLPNPDLKPEQGLGSDLGMELRPMRGMSLKVRGFYNRVSDMILDNVVSTNPSQTKSINAGKATSRGAELSIEQDVAENFQWFANLTFTTSEVSNPLSPDQDGTDITFVPNRVANLGLTAQLPFSMTVSPYLHMVGSYYDSTSRSSRKEFGPYNILNLRIQKALVKNGEYTVNASLDLNNVFDKRYEMPWQFQDPGFNVFANLEFRF
jgi:iron complex outermembrane recepter protein